MKKFIKENLSFIICCLIIAFLFTYKLPYYINSPGGTIEINDRISCQKCQKTNGSINLLYVSEAEATIPTYLLSYIIPNWDLEKIKNQQINNESPEEIYNRNRLMLDSSIDSAILVAYQASNKQIKIKSKKNLVLAVTNNNKLKIGDEILKVDNKEIDDINEIKKIINAKNIGDYIKITIKRNKEIKDINVKIKNSKGKKIIGVIITTDYDYEIDPKIKIKFKKSESGSSGGLMLALSIYNKINQEDIIRGRKIAGTGTIDAFGEVGEIDGIKYKIMGANKNKVDVVLVPKENYQEAIKIKKKYNYKMKIIKVKTFNDAINYLKDSK